MSSCVSKTCLWAVLYWCPSEQSKLFDNVAIKRLCQKCVVIKFRTCGSNKMGHPTILLFLSDTACMTCSLRMECSALSIIAVWSGLQEFIYDYATMHSGCVKRKCIQTPSQVNRRTEGTAFRTPGLSIIRVTPSGTGVESLAMEKLPDWRIRILWGILPQPRGTWCFHSPRSRQPQQSVLPPDHHAQEIELSGLLTPHHRTVNIWLQYIGVCVHSWHHSSRVC
jgi:hypothetical protein